MLPRNIATYLGTLSPSQLSRPATPFTVCTPFISALFFLNLAQYIPNNLTSYFTFPQSFQSLENIIKQNFKSGKSEYLAIRRLDIHKYLVALESIHLPLSTTYHYKTILSQY
jgi:hypothetical protein